MYMYTYIYIHMYIHIITINISSLGDTSKLAILLYRDTGERGLTTCRGALKLGRFSWGAALVRHQAWRHCVGAERPPGAEGGRDGQNKLTEMEISLCFYGDLMAILLWFHCVCMVMSLWVNGEWMMIKCDLMKYNGHIVGFTPPVN